LLGESGSSGAAYALKQAPVLKEGGLPKVEIYTKLTCGFCYRAKKLLDMKKVPYEEYSVDFGGAKKAEMIELEYQGRLDELLAA